MAEPIKIPEIQPAVSGQIVIKVTGDALQIKAEPSVVIVRVK